MTNPDNIERFNTVVSQIFSPLYEEFPSPMDLGVEHLGISEDLDGISTWHDEDWEPMMHTLIWLTEEGYIRTRGYMNDERYLRWRRDHPKRADGPQLDPQLGVWSGTNRRADKGCRGQRSS
jgi:hypothetical protein